jgi:DNA polymerase III epsilon subunit-like protein
MISMMKYHSKLPNKTLFLDIETTGNQDAAPGKDTIIEIAIVDDNGRTIMNTLVNPERSIGNTKIGISDGDLKNKRTLRQLWPMIETLVTGCHVVTYNAERDKKYFPKQLAAAGHISCAMARFAPIYGEYDKYHGDYRFKKLTDATAYIDYKWVDRKHRALPDALACRAVWIWMENRDDFNGAVPFSEIEPDNSNVIQF